MTVAIRPSTAVAVVILSITCSYLVVDYTDINLTDYLSQIVWKILNLVSWLLVRSGLFKIYCYTGLTVTFTFGIVMYWDSREAKRRNSGKENAPANEADELYAEVHEETDEFADRDFKAYEKQDLQDKVKYLLSPGSGTTVFLEKLRVLFN